MATAYARGTYLERRAGELLVEEGYFVVRSSGSHGIADFVAIKAGRPLVLAQCKGGKGQISHEEWNTLYELAKELSAIPLLVRWVPSHRSIQWSHITGPHVARKQDWPSVSWEFR